MPQGKRKSLDQIAAETFKQPERKSLDQIAVDTGIRPGVGFGEGLGQGIAGAVLETGVKPAVSLYGAIGSALGGDYQPLLEMAERAGRGLLQTDLGIPGSGAPVIEKAQAREWRNYASAPRRDFQNLSDQWKQGTDRKRPNPEQQAAR